MNDLVDKLGAYFSQNSTVSLVLLFGSQARATASETSDIDIGVLFKAPPHILDIGRIVGELELAFDRRVDLVDLHGIERSDPLLAYHIACDGIVIKAESLDVYITFKTRAFLSYFDIQNFLEKARGDLENRIDRGNFGRPRHA